MRHGENKTLNHAGGDLPPLSPAALLGGFVGKTMVSDHQINHIMECMANGLEAWWLHEGTAMKITVISGAASDNPIASFSQGFIELNNTDPADIFIGQRMEPNDQSQATKPAPDGSR